MAVWKKVLYSLMARHPPPPLLNGTAIKNSFFAASLTLYLFPPFESPINTDLHRSKLFLKRRSIFLPFSCKWAGSFYRFEPGNQFPKYSVLQFFFPRRVEFLKKNLGLPIPLHQLAHKKKKIGSQYTSRSVPYMSFFLNLKQKRISVKFFFYFEF